MSRTLLNAAVIAIIAAAILVAVDRYQAISERRQTEQVRAEQTANAPRQQVASTTAALETDVARNFVTLTAGVERENAVATSAANASTRVAQARAEALRTNVAATQVSLTEAAGSRATSTAIVSEASRLGTESAKQVSQGLSSASTSVAATLSSLPGR